MFTGIIEELGTVKDIGITGNSAQIKLSAEKVLENTRIGDSIAVNGVCLTVTGITSDGFSADVMPETLKRTSLSIVRRGDKVNLERAMAADGRFGGHIVSGHIDGTGTIRDYKKDGNAVWVTISAPDDILKLVVEKGSIAIDGISLTVASVGKKSFTVSIIPHTISNTTLADKKSGDIVNLETDIIGKYVEKLLMTGSTNDQDNKTLSGDFDKAKVLEKVEKEFDFKGRPNAPKKEREIDSPTDKQIVVKNTGKVNTSYLMLGWLGPKASELKENIELDIISIILGESTSSRMYQNLIEKQPEPIFTMANAEHYQFKDGNNFFLQANFKPEKQDLAIELVKGEVTGLLTNKITTEELEKAKKKIKSRFAYAAETVSEIGETIGYYMTVCEDLKLVEEYLSDLNSITIEDLENTIRKYLDLNNAVVSILEPEK